MASNNNIYKVTFLFRHTDGKDVSHVQQVNVAATAGDESTIKTALTNNGFTKANSNIEIQSIVNVLQGAYS